MCRAHVLRFCCGHGILMSIETCSLGPCPMIKPCGVKLPQQPFRCYNCQHRLSSSPTTSSASRDASCTSSIGSLDSATSMSSSSTDGRPSSSSKTPTCRVSHPLPGVARQPASTVQYCHNYNKKASLSEKAFTFSCQSSDHYATPHYATLPSFLPHQDHPCPPCQIEGLRVRADIETATAAAIEYPNLRGEMLVKNGRRQDEWEGKLTLERYVDEKRQEERQLWFNVTRKWTQDLKRARVLVAEEDGLGLMG